MRPSRVWSLLLLPCGLAVGHAVGYAAAHLAGTSPSLASSRVPIDTLFCLGVPLCIAALGRSALAGANQQRNPVRWSLLVPLQVVLFVGVELLEHVHAGLGPASTFRETSLIVGIVAQLVVAAAMCWLAHLANRVGARVASAASAQPRGHDLAVVYPSNAAPALLGVAISSVSRRGPPCVQLA